MIMSEESTQRGTYRKKIDSKHLLVQLSTRCYPAQQQADSYDFDYDEMTMMMTMMMNMRR